MNKITLTHWSNEPLKEVKPATQAPAKERNNYWKPDGLWLSDESSEVSWSTWCRQESYPIGSIRNDVDVDLTDVMVLRSYKDLEDFMDKYSILSPLSLELARKCRTMDVPNWMEVANDCKGILITPYISEARFQWLWYATWDVASGCFWDPSCLSIRGN